MPKSNRLNMGPQLFRILLVINIFVFITETLNYSYRFNVYPVDECPNNRTEFETAAKRRNCTGNTRYLCAPDKYLTSLIEFCTDQKKSLYGKDNCIKLDGTGNLNHYKCADKFISGCPTMPYTDEDIYDYPACITINKDRRCFVAEKDCHERHSATTEANGNRSRGENGGNKINPDGIKMTSLIVVILLLVMLIILGLTLFIFYKKRKKEKEGMHLQKKLIEDGEITDIAKAEEMHVGGKIIEGKRKVDNLPVIKKIYEEEATFKKIHIDATKELTVCHLSFIIVGCTGAGKTTLLKRLGNLTFETLKSIESTEIGGVHANSFEVLEDEETIQNLFGIVKTKPKDLSSWKKKIFPERDKKYISDSEDTSENTKLLCLSQCKKETVKEDREHEENRKRLPFSQNKISNSEKNCSQLYPGKSHRKSNACIKADISLQDDERYAILKIIDDFKNLPSENTIRPLITFLDIPSPSVYYAFHQTYSSPNTCYIMVVDMTKSPNDQVLEHVDEIDCCRTKPWKYQDFFKFWLQSIHSYSGDKIPTVILVGTHGDKMSKASCRKFFREVFEIFGHYPHLKMCLHPDRTFAIGFPRTESELENLTDIKKCIAKLVRGSTSFEERIRPVWAIFEHILQRKKIKRIISRKMLTEINNRLNEELRIDEAEIEKMLCFLHRVGTLLYFDEKGLNETVVLDIQWFVDAFKTVINFPVDINDLDNSLQRFGSTGVLDDEEINKIWKSRAKKGYFLHKKEILAYMERLGLLAIIYENGALYYIPTMNKRKFVNNDIHKGCSKSSILCFLFDENGQLPVFLFYGIVLKCIKIPKWSVLPEKNDQMCLYENLACFLFNHHTVVVCLCKYKIQVQVLDPTRNSIDVNLLREIQQTVEEKIQEYKGYTYKIGYECKNGLNTKDGNSFIARAEFPVSTHICQNCKGEKPHFVDNTVCWIHTEKQKFQGAMENPLYRERSPGIKFAKFSNYLAKHFPLEKLQTLEYLLKASGKVKNMMSLQSAKSAMEYFTILQDEKLFSPNDVIFMQFLFKETNCQDLYTRCIEYASNEKALCCFERPPDKGCKNVEFHIQGELKDYAMEEIKLIVEVVAEILGCKADEIRVNGFRPSASFFLVLSIIENYTQKLYNMTEEDRHRLTELNIDNLNVDENTITVNSENDNLTCSYISPVHKTEDSFIDQNWREKEIRIVLLGNEGTDKSATGNIILGEEIFYPSVSGYSLTNRCFLKHAVRFGCNIVVVDTPGVFDTKESNEKRQNEICICLGITSPGPHAFILVLNLSRYTMEEQKTIEQCEKYFGEKLYNYLIILFTGKDDLDDEGVELTDKLKTVSVELKALIARCDGRVIAFNNRLKGEQQNAQVINLLSMISKNIKSNHGGCYTSDMYLEAEKQIKKPEEEMVIKAVMKWEKEY